MSICEKLDNLICKQEVRLSYEEMEDLFGRDYRNNIIVSPRKAYNKLIFTEGDNLYYVNVSEHVLEREYCLYEYHEADNDLFERTYDKYKEIMREAKIFEKVVNHKKFRLKKLFLKGDEIV